MSRMEVVSRKSGKQSRARKLRLPHCVIYVMPHADGQ